MNPSKRRVIHTALSKVYSGPTVKDTVSKDFQMFVINRKGKGYR